MVRGSQAELSFPPDFVWGAATSSYQIEGSTRADGRGESIWDRFASVPGAIADGSSGEPACDHYRRWREDVELMRELGLDAYRFSIAWPRILPEGKGQVNKAGLDFYERLVDALLASNIKPFATLYHWDLPQALQDRGGWPNRETAYRFVDYVEAVANRMGDRIGHWITHNEPMVVTFAGHWHGEHAPGIRDRRQAYAAAHHLLLSHGLAVEALRALSPSSQVGITLNLVPVYPASDKAEDERAARFRDGRQNRWFLDPVIHGRYPEDVLERIRDYAPPVEDGDLQKMAAPIDFLGVNYYSRQVVRHDPSAQPFGTSDVKPAGAEYTDMEWEVYPDGLRDLLERLHREYPVPAYYITENGAAYPDAPDADGQVRDPKRVAYLESHLGACSEAIRAGVPLKGYFAWSLLDNWEWAYGYTKRFGLVYVDYATRERIPKESAHWYRQVIEGQRSGT